MDRHFYVNGQVIDFAIRSCVLFDDSLVTLDRVDAVRC
jgi:hypothetical protein